MDSNEEYVMELEQEIDKLEAENEELNNELDTSEQDYQSLETAYDSLEQDYDDLYKEHSKLVEKVDTSSVSEIINDIHSMIDNGITSGDFKKIADMLSIKYSIKEPIYGLDFGE